MKPTSAFYNAVKSGKILRVRIMMEDSLLIDKTFKRFSEMERAAKNMEGLYDEHDGKQFVLDRSLWTEAYMDTLMVELVNNFSHERIAHLKEVVRYLYPVNQKKITILDAIYRDIISKYDIKIKFSNSLKEFKLNKDNKEEFKRLVMEEIKKQLEIKNEFVYNNIINGSYFNEIDYV